MGDYNFKVPPIFPFFKEFSSAPFQTLDNLDLHWHGFQFNLLRNDKKLRKAILEIFCIPSLIMWLLLGVDSTVDQVNYFLCGIPNFLLKKITFNQLIQIYNSYYGLGTHWSAAVIYSLLLIGLSKHLNEKLGIKNSLNLALTTGFVGISIASFEWFWQISYYIFQGQHWILWYKFPQARILNRNILFLLPGIIILQGLNWKKYKLNMDRITFFAFFATIGLIIFWWFYPFPTQQLTVEIKGYGIWSSSQHFPQTMYTIQSNINEAFGIMYHVENVGVHLTNNLTKIAMTLMFYSLFKIEKRKPFIIDTR